MRAPTACVVTARSFELTVTPSLSAEGARHVVGLPDNKAKFGLFTAHNAQWGRDNDHLVRATSLHVCLHVLDSGLEQCALAVCATCRRR